MPFKNSKTALLFRKSAVTAAVYLYKNISVRFQHTHKLFNCRNCTLRLCRNTVILPGDTPRLNTAAARSSLIYLSASECVAFMNCTFSKSILASLQTLSPRSVYQIRILCRFFPTALLSFKRIIAVADGRIGNGISLYLKIPANNQIYRTDC